MEIKKKLKKRPLNNSNYSVQFVTKILLKFSDTPEVQKYLYCCTLPKIEKN